MEPTACLLLAVAGQLGCDKKRERLTKPTKPSRMTSAISLTIPKQEAGVVVEQVGPIRVAVKGRRGPYLDVVTARKRVGVSVAGA